MSGIFTNKTPEELCSADAPQLLLEVRCNRCELGYSAEVDWACVDPTNDPAETAWDGILLSQIIQCAGCGAVDDYTFVPDSLRRLAAEARPKFRWTRRRSRIIVGVSQLWDGSIAHRPSQALVRLRQLAAEQPKSAEAFRRLGNGCERWSLMGEAVTAWEKAVDLDPDEVEAAYSLAAHWLGPGRRPAKGVACLRRSLRALPKAAAVRPETRKVGPALVWLLRDIVEESNDPIALMAVWSAGSLKGQPVVSMSSVDLRKVADFELLAAFVANPDVMALDLTPELPEDEPTILQRLLGGDSPTPSITSSWLPVAPSQGVHAGRTISRNAPCPCGSRKRYKRCCGKRTTG